MFRVRPQAGTVKTEDTEHPFELVYVIVLLPCATPRTTPVEVMVATTVFPDTHVPDEAGDGVPESGVKNPGHTERLPEMDGSGLMVTEIPFDVTDPGTAQASVDDVITQVTVCPLVNAVVWKFGLFVPALTPSTFHW